MPEEQPERVLVADLHRHAQEDAAAVLRVHPPAPQQDPHHPRVPPAEGHEEGLVPPVARIDRRPAEEEVLRDASRKGSSLFTLGLTLGSFKSSPTSTWLLFSRHDDLMRSRNRLCVGIDEHAPSATASRRKTLRHDGTDIFRSPDRIRAIFYPNHMIRFLKYY
jgi:hypothetical protein